MYPLEPELRRDMVAQGQQLAERGWVSSTHGSISGRLDSDLILCTPTGVAKGELRRDSMVKVSLIGERCVGSGIPTSALPIHKALYAHTGAGAVLHSQPPHVLTALEAVVPPVGQDESVQGQVGQHPVIAVAGASPGQAAAAIARGLAGAEGVLVDGLGFFVWGADLAVAMQRLEAIERAAQVEPPAAPVPSPGMQELVERLALRVTEAMAARDKQPATMVSATAVSLPASSSEPPAGSEVAASPCNACGRCTNSGGSLPSARREAALEALGRISDAELVAMIVETTREVLGEKGLL